MTEIKLKQVRKSYGTVKVLQGIDLTVGDGRVLCVRRPVGLRKIHAVAGYCGPRMMSHPARSKLMARR
jgi:ABC-type transporter Mla maintaining outer membrane lipid asymmetry ATPase subunit MlaF